MNQTTNMRKKLFHFTIIAAIMFLGACSNEDLLPDAKTGKGRTFSLTASIPDDNPTTRVSLTQDGKNIKLKWEMGDQLQLAFVQGATKIKSTMKVVSISEDGKKAQFEINLPESIGGGEFDLYGVYGGGGLSETDPTHVILPSNSENSGSLESIEEKEHVILYFVLKAIQPTKPPTTVNFLHLGSLFNITIKNTSTSSLDNISEARLVGVGGDGNWAFNSGAGGEIYDLASGEFLNQESAGDYVSFNSVNNSLPSDDLISFWGWYSPLPNKNWPELKLELRDASTSSKTSFNSKPARTTPTEAGISYYFYALWNGSQLGFTDELFNPPLGPNEFYVETMGTLGAILSATQKATIETMILKGEINKADFDVMKNQMPNLKYLDLKDVKCEGDKIPHSAFGDNDTNLANTHLTTIILPTDLTSIEGFAFARCSGLKGSLTLSDKLIKIEIMHFLNVLA